MKWKVSKSELSGTITIPPSKSHTIRALLIASLANGKSVIRKPLLTGDGVSALDAASALGAKVEIDNEDVIITGIGDSFDSGKDNFFMGNSGTGTNLFASAAALGTKSRTFDGDDSLRSRPFSQILESLKDLGAAYTKGSDHSDLPFTIRGPLQGGKTRVNGISSQFVSSLLLTCPLIKGKNTELSVYNLHEKPYVELTLWWLNKQGIKYECSDDYSSFCIEANQGYKPFDITVPSDFSSATFAAVGAAITNGSVELKGLDFTDPQGDKGVFDILESAGAKIEKGSGCVNVSGNAPLDGKVIDLNSMPDALPAIAVLACCSQGETRITNIGHARIKETDRISVMQKELTKMGADIRETGDDLLIRHSNLHGANVCGHHDHRVIMALALAGMTADGETIIDTAESAQVTYPDFVRDFSAIGANIKTLG
ncbi:MAG: 3-phosphoshikimate 1-carboxyvinyltransferase [Fibrobacter sp.]|nr:3-phosphoshikimate 1-carboxyvinyltransferase [Fibrobacter sp.]